jgi:hypothetical protein
MYKLGGEDVISDASTEGSRFSRMRPGRMGKAQGAVRVAVLRCGQTRHVWKASCVRVKQE